MRDYQATPDFYNDYISHHGILKMKWGERHGPPYPLDSSISTGSSLKKGSMGKGAVKKKNKKIDKEIKKASKTKGSDTYYENDPKMAEKLNNEMETVIKESKDRLEKADLFTEHNYTRTSSEKDKQRGRDAADLGLEALNKIGRLGYEPENGITEGDREWFIWEDQTIGLATIADLVNQGKSKEEIKDLIRDAENVYINEDYMSHKPGTFQLAESYVPDKFIDACIEIRDSRNNGKKGSMGKPKIDPDKVYVKRPDNLSEVKLSKEESRKKNEKSVSKWIDEHTVTREPKTPTSTPRFGERMENGKVIRTSNDMINAAVERGLAENKARRDKAVNDNQDMFNDLLYNSKYGNNSKADTKTYQDEIKRIAKEYKINKKDLQKDIEANFNKRETNIAKSNKTDINKALNNARTKDQYSINFLEATQNSPWTEAHITGDMSDAAYKTKMLQEYKKYLQDPEKYWKSR